MNPVKQVFELRRSGRLKEAIELARVLVQSQPGDVWHCRALGWCLHDQVRACIWATDLMPVQGLLDEYARMEVVERPSLLHSAMLSAATQCAGQVRRYAAFVRWWDPASFAPGDYERQTRADGKAPYPSLAEKVAKAMYRCVKAGSAESFHAAWAAEFIESMTGRFPDNEWLPYYRAKLWIVAGRVEHAREQVLPLVRSKRGEFWAWDLLADLCGDADAAGRMACLARAALCRVRDETFLVNIHERLAYALHAAGEPSAAKVQMLDADRLRISKGWRMSTQAAEFLAGLVRSGVPTESADAHLERLKGLASLAEDLLAEDLPWFPAVVTGHRAPDGDRAGATFLKVRLREHESDLMVRHSKFPAVAEMHRGAPLSVRVTDARGHVEIMGVAPREAEDWDLIPVEHGIVTAVQAEEGRTWIALGKGRSCSVPHRIFPGASALFPGEQVDLRFRTNPTTQRTDALSIERSAAPADATLWRDVEGTLRLSAHGGFGFVESIFVPPDVIAEGEFGGGERVRVGAVADWDRTKNRPSWKAVIVERTGG